MLTESNTFSYFTFATDKLNTLSTFCYQNVMSSIKRYILFLIQLPIFQSSLGKLYRVVKHSTMDKRQSEGIRCGSFSQKIESANPAQLS
jgi:hypothetical protein